MLQMYNNNFTFVLIKGNLEAFKKQAFILKEGVEYKIKISFKVSIHVIFVQLKCFFVFF